MPKYRYMLELEFELSEEQEAQLMPCIETGDEVCEGNCGGECESYFYQRMKAWNVLDPSIEFYGSHITRVVNDGNA